MIVYRLGQEGVHASLHASFLELIRRISRQGSDVDRLLRENLPDFNGRLESVHYRHVAVHKYQLIIRALFPANTGVLLIYLGSLFDYVECLPAG